jgi:hypothetical protein
VTNKNNDLYGVAKVPGTTTGVWAVGDADGHPLILHHS